MAARPAEVDEIGIPTAECKFEGSVSETESSRLLPPVEGQDLGVGHFGAVVVTGSHLCKSWIKFTPKYQILSEVYQPWKPKKKYFSGRK